MTVTAAKTAIVKEIVLCNTGATSRLIDIHFVPSGGSGTATNQIRKGDTTNSPLLGGVTERIPLNTYLAAGDFVRAKQDVGTDVSIRISYVEI